MQEREKFIFDKVIDILKVKLAPEKIIFFGSRAKGKEARGSDFDFAVFCPKPDISLEREVNEAIDKISGLYKVDIVYAANLDPKFKEIITQTGKVVYERK